MSIRSFLEDERYNIKRTMALDPAAKSKWEVAFLYPHIKALRYHRIAHWLWTHNHHFAARWLSQKARHKTGIEIHPGAQIGRGLVIDHGMGVVIGETSIVEDDCQLYHGVTLGGRGTTDVKRHPTLKKGAFVGAGAKVLGNVTLGENSKVGSNAVVLMDVPAGTTAVGLPAHIVKKHKEEKREDVEIPL
jgi:serine O-acetyltransferase